MTAHFFRHLTVAQVNHVLDLLAQGHSQSRAAIEVGIGQSSVSRIAAGRTLGRQEAAEKARAV